MKLLECCSINPKKVNSFNSKKKYIATGDVEQNDIVSSSLVTYENRPSRANVLIAKNDVIFAKMKNTNKVLLGADDNIDYIYSTGFYCLTPDESKIHPKLLYYYLSSDLFNEQKDKNCTGATMKAINDKGLERIELNLPQCSEQKKIVNELDKITLAINNRKNNIIDCEKYLDSKFNEMFGNLIINEKGWEKVLLSQLGTLKNGMNFNKEDSGYSVKFLGVGEFKYGDIIYDINLLQNISLSDKPDEDLLLKNNDIIFVRSNGSKELVGRSVLITDFNDEATYSGFCIRFRNESKLINPKFLIKLFQKEEFKRELKKDSRGANINNINQQMLSNLEIIIPPMELQDEFVNKVNYIEKLKQSYKKDINDLQNLLNKKMNDYFN